MWAVHPAYKPPLRFVLRLRLQKGGGGGGGRGHYGKCFMVKLNSNIFDAAMANTIIIGKDYHHCITLKYVSTRLRIWGLNKH